MAAPTVEDVLAYLGKSEGSVSVEQVQAHLSANMAFCAAHTRGEGFEDGVPAEDLAQVIITLTARSVDNPVGDRQQTAGPFTRTAAAPGLTLAEIRVLNSYRVTAR